MHEMENMIQNGQFGVNSPIQQQTGYNPYMNQPTQFNNMNPLPNNNNGFIYQPIPQPYQQPQYDYYNPYGPPINYGYNNYGYYGGYKPYISPQQQDKLFNEKLNMVKLKFRIAATYLGNTIDEDKLDQMLNPKNKINIPTTEELARRQEYDYVQHLSQIANSTYPQPESNAQMQARLINTYSYSMHQELDNHSLAEFFVNDFWKLKRDQWVRENIARKNSRNLSAVYDSKDYNELLNLHRSSSNPYINELLDTSKYDNNIDDLELGMNIVYDRERRRQAILNGKVPSFISSEETQKRRSEWTNAIINQIYGKGGQVPNV
jgi:hypothetical protein